MRLERDLGVLVGRFASLGTGLTQRNKFKFRDRYRIILKPIPAIVQLTML
jgi:hypothetical protein